MPIGSILLEFSLLVGGLTILCEGAMTQVEILLKSRKDYYSLSAEATALEAARYLRDQGVRATVVCDGQYHAIGL